MPPERNTKEALQDLWDRVGECAGPEVDLALEIFLTGVCDLIDAQDACWAAAIRLPSPTRSDSTFGWRFREVIHLKDGSDLMARCEAVLNQMDRGKASSATIKQFSETGIFRSSRMCDRMSADYLDGPEFFAEYGSAGITDVLFVETPLNDGMESIFSFQHMEKGRRFSREDLMIATDAVRALKWFQRQLALSYGLLLVDDPITPAERRVLQQLLTHRSEKEIAAVLALSPLTVHSHVKTIYKKLGIGNRSGIAALWLGNGEVGGQRYRALTASR